MIWINLVAIGALFFAGVRVWKMLTRRRRRPRVVETSCLIAWQQSILVGRRSLARQLIVILPHGLTQALISALLQVSLNRAAPSPLSTGFEAPSAQWLFALIGYYDSQLNSIGWSAGIFAALLAGSILGAFGGYWLSMALGPPVSMSLSPHGVWFGVLLLPWQQVGSAQLNSEKREILLFSSGYPESIPAVLSALTREQYDKVVGILRNYLAAEVINPGSMQPRGRWKVSVVFFELALIAAAVVASLVYLSNGEWIWLFYGIELVCLSLIGRFFFNKWLPGNFIEVHPTKVSA